MKNNSSLAAHFAKRNTKNCGGEKRSGESEGGPRRRNFVSLRGKQKFFLFACPVASRGLCYGARPSVQFGAHLPAEARAPSEARGEGETNRLWWTRWDLNPRSPGCKPGILPLNYRPKHWTN